jgi:GMP synthase-like glutamine amidotransferase
MDAKERFQIHRKDKMRVHHLQHVPFEALGSMESYLRSRGHRLTSTHLYLGQPLPDPEAFDWLIVMGGPMGVHDTSLFPWLNAEKEFLAQAMQHGKTVLGICLGAQLIADVLGARVSKNKYREIGWFPIIPAAQAADTLLAETLPRPFEAFHWHGDTFELPAGATLLASSEACRNQGFIADNHIVALQFHLETTMEAARMLLDHCRNELDGSPFVQKEAELLAGTAKFDAINQVMGKVLEALEKHSAAGR